MMNPHGGSNHAGIIGMAEECVHACDKAIGPSAKSCAESTTAYTELGQTALDMCDDRSWHQEPLFLAGLYPPSMYALSSRSKHLP